MRAGLLVIALALIAFVPAQGHGGGGGGGHGGGGHGGGHGGHFGGHGSHFGGYDGGGKAGKRGGFWHRGRSSGSAFRRIEAVPRITTFVGIGSVPGLRVGVVADSLFCPLAPHLISPFCPVCSFPGPFGFRHRFFGFSEFGFVGDGGPWLGFDDESPESAVPSPLPLGASPQFPVLVFRNGWSVEVTDYGIDEEGELRYVTSYGGLNIVSLNILDLYATVKANEQRGIPFTLKLYHRP